MNESRTASRHGDDTRRTVLRWFRRLRPLEAQDARDRIQTVLFTATGIAAVIFTAIHLPKIMDQYRELAFSYWVMALIVGVVLPASLVLIARITEPYVARIIAGATVLLFSVTHALWPLAMTVDVHPDVPWLQGVNAIPAFLAAVVWQRWPVWIYAFAQLPIVLVTEALSTDGGVRLAVLSGTVSLLFSVILVGVGVALMDAADKHDALSRETRTEAARAASATTAVREESRIDGVVHDRVLVALLVASRGEDPERVSQHAIRAIEALSSLAADRNDEVAYSVADALDALRNAATSARDNLPVEISVASKEHIPAMAVRALSQAMAEAVLNSVKHAQDGTRAVARNVSIDVEDSGINIVVQDDGRGFDPALVDSRRLGLRTSILDRMNLIEGGSASIESGVGEGTKVRLSWSRSAS